MGKSQDLYKKAKKLIPGGTQLLSKRPEMFLPDLWPAYYSKAKGCQVWDLDGNKYTDMSYMGIGSCILGYANEIVNDSVKNAVDNGNMTTLNAPEEVELAELLCKIHPWADEVRYTRTGGESMAVAVRIARAKTQKDIVLFCGYHGWHDWYLAANLADTEALDGHLLPGLSPRGVPRGLKGTSFPFKYNDIESFTKLYNEHKGNIAAIVMEPLRNTYPEQDFINIIHEKTQCDNIVLVVDEITAGWRLNHGGAHLILGIKPDIAVFGKAISNGYPMGAIIGKKDVMDAAQDTFISSTYWTDRIGLVSSIATINTLKKDNVSQHLKQIGKTIQDGWTDIALSHDIEIEVGGIYPLGHFSFKHKEALKLKTLFTKLMMEKGFLATTAFYASYAQKDKDINAYLHAVDEVFSLLSKYIKENTIKEHLNTPVCHSGFSRLT
ncbi:aminotransferase class III-fold pyridoxal phosphate-dependent enzyme [Sulfurimonas autotrophica]|uniref:Aminotransferase class-III n=1 Tax=Sulfurimonas autotrophica (strain ATCC BAA-671 / DSM 16294 / JCM 11897 / OK10) TaxID=563040 RepID=E0UT79_SULAO|nr:aminotransferase class III-fold pyridoxal phosphate-dependent enzyme [Sulfurimonas autotrophica]ADN08182.1 aminotransferase class-III [Sulfurimonas autotrophica DSM 16294]